MEWPFLLGKIAHDVILEAYDKEKNKNFDRFDIDALKPSTAADIFMQSAIFMSAINPDIIYGAYLPSKGWDFKDKSSQ